MPAEGQERRIHGEGGQRKEENQKSKLCKEIQGVDMCGLWGQKKERVLLE